MESRSRSSIENGSTPPRTRSNGAMNGTRHGGGNNENIILRHESKNSPCKETKITVDYDNLPSPKVIQIPPLAKEGDTLEFEISIDGEKRSCSVVVPNDKYFAAQNGIADGTRKRRLRVVFVPDCLGDYPKEQQEFQQDKANRQRALPRNTALLISPINSNVFNSHPWTPNRQYLSSPSIYYSPRRQKKQTGRQQGSAVRRQLDVELKKFRRSTKEPRIGSIYQISPSSIPEVDSRLTSFQNQNRYPQIEQLWDPRKGLKAENEGGNIYNLIDDLPTNKKEIFMECLHKCDYNVYKAWERYLDEVGDLLEKGKLHGNGLSKNEAQQFNEAFWESRKDMKKLLWLLNSKAEMATKRSLATLLVHYYGQFKPSENYKVYKSRSKQEDNYCRICDDGGTLICCDSCEAAYHLDCLDPPLQRIPEGKWQCPECICDQSNKRHDDNCRVCDEGGTLICCDSCEAAYHLDCLDPPPQRIPEGKWQCPECICDQSNKQQENKCHVCDEGGTLICYDSCEAAYHLDCLDPPLKRIPEGQWQCPECILCDQSDKNN